MFYLWTDQCPISPLNVFSVVESLLHFNFFFILPHRISYSFTIGFRAQKEVLSRERNAGERKLAREWWVVIRWIINWWIEGVVTRLERARVAWLRKHLHRILRRTRPKLDPSAAVGLARAPSGYVCGERDGGPTRLCACVCVPAAIG